MQLLAAWLVGLLAIDSCFLLAATRFPIESTESIALTWASILNVPLFLGALFLLQTRFRPELQEDLYYSTYINQKTNQTVSVSRTEQKQAIVLGKIERVENLVKAVSHEPLTRDHRNLLYGLTFGINRHLSEKTELSAKLSEMGVERHTWFGGDEPPKGLVVSISEYLTQDTQDAVLALVDKLGFTRYNLFDNQMEETEEDILIGSYGTGDRMVPNAAK